MGGRGSSAKKKDYLTLSLGGEGQKNLKYKGYQITFMGETHNLYFTKIKGKNYVQYGVAPHSEVKETPMNFSAEQYVRRAKSNGASVKKITQEHVRNAEKAWKKYEAEKDQFMNDSYARDPLFKKHDAAARKSRRASKKGIGLT